MIGTHTGCKLRICDVDIVMSGYKAAMQREYSLDRTICTHRGISVALYKIVYYKVFEYRI